MATNTREHEGERRAFECTRFLFNFIIFILWMAPPPFFKLSYCNPIAGCAAALGVKIGRESCDNSLHQLSVRAPGSAPHCDNSSSPSSWHGRLCNAQPSELSAVLVTASNKSFYFSLLAGWCKAVNGTSRISQCPKKALTIGTLVYKDHNRIAHQL